ncbi:MAG: PA2779 family protein [Burkholderiales bacterium]
MSAMNGFWTRSIACVVALSISNVATFPTAHAALISTGQVAQAATQDRVAISTVLARPEIQAELIRRGVSVDEANQRVAALTDDEARTLSQQLDSLPAGGIDVLGTVLIVFIVLLITDILGFTKVFSFTRPIK